MKDIGKKLLEKRRALKLSYKEVSEMTRLSVSTIKAIEVGNLEFFKDNLTYVRFYVRSYCKAVDVPYENFKDDVLESVEEFTNTLTLKSIQSQAKMEQNINEHIEKKETNQGPIFARRDRDSMKQNAKSPYKKRKRIDFASLSLIICIFLIGIILLYVFMNMFLTDESSDSPSKEKQVEKETPKPEKIEQDNQDKEEDEIDKKAQVISSKIGSGVYEISGIKATEAIKLEVVFNEGSNFNLWKGTTAVPNASAFYATGQTFTHEDTVAINDEYTLNIWNFNDLVIRINDVEIKIDKDIAPSDGVIYVKLRLKGE